MFGNAPASYVLYVHCSCTSWQWVTHTAAHCWCRHFFEASALHTNIVRVFSALQLPLFELSVRDTNCIVGAATHPKPRHCTPTLCVCFPPCSCTNSSWQWVRQTASLVQLHKRQAARPAAQLQASPPCCRRVALLLPQQQAQQGPRLKRQAQCTLKCQRMFKVGKNGVFMV